MLVIMLGKLEFSFGGYEFFPSGRCLFYRILLESYAKDHKRGCMSQENICSMGCSRLGEDEQRRHGVMINLSANPMRSV